MVTVTKLIGIHKGKDCVEMACLSTDTKPTTGVANGSKCIEMDTGKKYMLNEEDSEWEELPSSGGGGGTTVEELSVTQNGTYTAPSGKAYSPVTVNVSGGSSDFSTATVTFINADTTTSPYFVQIFHITDGAYISTEEISVSDSVSVDVPLYKGRAEAELLILQGIAQSYLPTATGGVTFEMPKFIITGDGTITAKGRQPN